MKRALRIGLLEDVVAAHAMGEQLPEKNKNHALPALEYTVTCLANCKDSGCRIGCFPVRHIFVYIASFS